jgi:hypothetical protein
MKTVLTEIRVLPYSKMAATEYYDICILGAGIAGLYCALELSKRFPEANICILEKYKYIGGRTSTFKETIPGVGKVQWEAGAGRIHSSHHQTLTLLKKYGLETVPISGPTEWRTPSVCEPIETGKYFNNLSALQDLDVKTLRTNTLKDILGEVLDSKVSKRLIDTYEYRSELDTLRADKALDALSNVLGFHEGFCVVKEGFSALIRHLKQDIERAGVAILREHEAIDIAYETGIHTVSVKGRDPIKSKKVIVALTRDAVATLPCFKALPILEKVEMRPLVRIYAVFPKVNGKVWFEGVNRFTCAPPVRYTIPIDPSKGTIMISYTDGKDAEYWLKKMKAPGHLKTITAEIMEQVRYLFPEKDIPEPLYVKIHPWSDGCSYWTPGDYDFNRVSKASVKPLPTSMPGLYMCGESWAYNQAWVECAIDQARHAVEKFEL